MATKTMQPWEVMAAHAKGKKIEYRHRASTNGPWYPDPSPNWDWSMKEFRVAVRKKYAPLTYDPALVGRVVYRRHSKFAGAIQGVADAGVFLPGSEYVSFTDLARDYTFDVAGTRPCAKIN